MFYEPELINKRFDDIYKQINFIEDKGTDPQSLFVYFKGLGLLSNIKTYFVYKKLIRSLDKMLKNGKDLIDYLSCPEDELPSAKRVKQLTKITKHLVKTKKYADSVKTGQTNENAQPTNENADENKEFSKERIIANVSENNEQLKDAKRKVTLIYRAVREYLRNVLTVAFMPFTVVAYGLLALLLNNSVVNIASTALAFGCWAAYLTLRIIYLVKFTRYYHLDINATAIKFLYHLSVILLYLIADVIICLKCYNCKTLIPEICLLAICGVLILAFLYDIFCSSKFFTGELSYRALTVAIVLPLSIVLLAVKNVWVSQVVTGFLITAEAALILMIFKAFIIEQRKIETALQILCLVAVVLMCIGIGVVLIYRFTWVSSADGSPADNTLFSALMGVYAALIGGILTFTGVAWTIRHSERQRKADEKLRVRPYLVLDEYSPKTVYYPLPFLNSSSDPAKTVLRKIFVYVTDIADCVFLGFLIGNEFFPSDAEIYLKRNSFHDTDELRLSEDSLTGSVYLVAKDLLDNLYGYECVLKEDGSANGQKCKKYRCVDLGVPVELTAEQIKIINNKNK